MANQPQPVLSGPRICHWYHDMMSAWIHIHSWNQKLKRKIQLQAFSKEATMRMLRLIPILMLLGFIGLPVVPAFATCCSCTMGCARGCTCPGIGGCGTCAAEDFETVQSSSAATEATSDMTAVRKTMPSIATNSRMLDRLIRLGQTGQCALSKFALRLLADHQELLKLDQMFLSASASQAVAVALTITDRQ